MSEGRRHPRLWTISSSAPFLETLADALTSGVLLSPGDQRHDLADHLVLLPTRRACRALTDILVARADSEPLLLPRIRPIGDVDEAEIAMDEAGTGEDALLLPPAIPPLKRQILLTGLVLHWGRSIAQTLMVPGREEPVAIPVRPGDAALLARDLANLMDDFGNEAQDLARLQTLVPDDHADYWRITLEFLKIVTESWPSILASEGAVDPATRRDALLRAEAARLHANPPPGPVIAAGSTGTIPATAELLSSISLLPKGAVVLPGLDSNPDPESWQAIDDAAEPHPGHPQYGLKKLLGRLGAARSEVDTLGRAARPARERLVSEIFRPAATTDAWAEIGTRLDAHDFDVALSGVALVEAASEQEEATAVALMLREAAETPDRSAALVTPDRGLARRVSAELKRWNLTIDDSAGVPLADTPPGVLFRLIADNAASRLSPVSLVALLQHPLANFGLRAGPARQAARSLELLALRGPRPVPGSAGLLKVLEHRLAVADGERKHPSLKRRSESGRRAARELAASVAEAFNPLEELDGAGEVPLSALLKAHESVLANVTCRDDGALAAFEGEAGNALADFLAELAEAAEAGLALTLDEYPALLAILLSGRPVRPRGTGHPRLQILGPLEARLLSADLVILGGLNEGSWPADTRTDAFLNRPMRSEAGLEAPERFIGLAAHDVAGLMCAPTIVLSRSGKVGGEPTVPSRWLQRLKAVCGKARFKELGLRGSCYLDWARSLDETDGRDPVAEPEPCPPLEARPTGLSVTEIETLIRDPYAIYAKRILKLEPLDRLDEAPDAATRGVLIHEVMNRFSRAVRDNDAGDPSARLLEIGAELFTELDDFPEVKALWWPRFKAIARWYVAQEAALSAGIAEQVTEGFGRHRLDVDGKVFELRGRADRIDLTATGGLRIIDYKTGGVPTSPQVTSGLAPQLPLEAIMVKAGAFGEGLAGHPIDALVYIALKGGNPPGKVTPINPNDESLDDLAERIGAGVIRLLARFGRADSPYRAKTHVQQQRYGTDYDHLSRFAEWGAIGGNGEE